MKNFCIIFLLLLLFGCSKTKSNAVTDDSNSENLSTDNNEILVVDVTKEYPKSDSIQIQDIAGVEYISLETNKDFLCAGDVAYIDDSLIIYRNFNDGNIFIFSRTGKALKRINRKGQSREEYAGISHLVFDEKNNELYVNDMWQQKIFVYDLNGNYKRSFRHLSGSQYSKFYNLNEQTLLCYNGSSTVFDEEKYPFKIISKKNGEKIKDIEILFEKRISTKYKFVDEKTGAAQFYTTYPEPIGAVKTETNDFVLNEISSDTIYKLSEDFSITPFMIQVPSVHSMGENPTSLTFVMNIRDYQFLFIQEKKLDKETRSGFPTTNLVYDKKKKRLFEQNIYNRDRASESLDFNDGHAVHGNQIVHRYQAHKLKDYLEKGELSGKLKEIAENMDAEDNPVVMVITFKK